MSRRVLGSAHERGAALLTVLLLVAVMATVSATALDRLTLATRLTGNAVAAGQARQWLGMAEQLAAVRLEDMLAADAAQTTLAGGWHGTPRTIALPDGTQVTARVTDGGNCFNLNSLAALTSEGQLFVRPAAVQQFTALMTGVGVEPTAATRIAAAAADRIDSDSAVLPAGAEDGATPNRAMAHEAELARVPGVTAPISAMLRPWVCALPTHEPTLLNVNTLLSEQATLLIMLAPQQITPERARAVLAGRPAAGFGSTVAFWQSPALKTVSIPADAAEQVAVRSRFFRLEARVAGDGGEVGQSALLEARDGRVQPLRREWTIGG